MNKEEIEELKDFTIDFTDIDELALGLEVCSKKSNMVIQEFADTIIQLQQENQKYKEVIDKAIEYINNLECLHIGIGENEYNLDKMYGSTKNYVRDLLEILKGSDK